MKNKNSTDQQTIKVKILFYNSVQINIGKK